MASLRINGVALHRRENTIDLTAGQADVSGRIRSRLDLMGRDVGRHGRIARKALG
jgi:hypothetical protein